VFKRTEKPSLRNDVTLNLKDDKKTGKSIIGTDEKVSTDVELGTSEWGRVYEKFHSV
jgi:hypothetical protein